MSRNWTKAARISCFMAMCAADRRPCVRGAFRARSRPSGVRAPVLAPPCIRHLPFGIAGERQGKPPRVQAPHLGDAHARAIASRQPYAWGALSKSGGTPPPSLSTWRTPSPDLLLAADHGLAALADVVVLDHDRLLPAGPHPLQGLHPSLE